MQNDPENLQVDYRFRFSNLIFRPSYKGNIKKAWCIDNVCESVCDRQSAAKPFSYIFMKFDMVVLYTKYSRIL